MKILHDYLRVLGVNIENDKEDSFDRLILPQ
jgi:hypothetical protein